MKRTERIVIRVTPRVMGRAIAAAREANRKVADWARLIVEEEAARQIAHRRLVRDQARRVRRPRRPPTTP